MRASIRRRLRHVLIWALLLGTLQVPTMARHDAAPRFVWIPVATAGGAS